jgi:hypothetical protein
MKSAGLRTHALVGVVSPVAYTRPSSASCWSTASPGIQLTLRGRGNLDSLILAVRDLKGVVPVKRD